MIRSLVFIFGVVCLFIQTARADADWEFVLNGFSSDVYARQDEAAQRLGNLTGPEALSFSEFVLTGQSLVPSHPFNFSGPRQVVSFVHQQARESVARNFSKLCNEPEFIESFKRVRTRLERDNNATRELQKGVLDCEHPSIEFSDVASNTSNVYGRAAAYKMLGKLDMSDEVYDRIKTGLKSVDHPVKEGAAYSLIGRTEIRILPLIEMASRSLYRRTRMDAIAALAKIQSPNVFDLYAEGLRDSEILVRVYAMHELSKRSESRARLLLEMVAFRSKEIASRTNEQQWARVPFRERMAEWIKGAYAGDSPTVDFMEGFTMAYRSIERFLQRWRDDGLKEADLAQKLLNEMADRPKSTIHDLPCQEWLTI